MDKPESYFVYILHSIEHDRYYIGQTNNIITRIEKHNGGGVKSTKPYRPWKVVYQEEYPTRSEAMAREKELKSWKSKVKIIELVDTSR